MAARSDSKVMSEDSAAGSFRRTSTMSLQSERVSVQVDGGVVNVTVSQMDDLMDNLDANGDGIVDADEMRIALPWLALRADILLVRLATERKLVQMMRKLPQFFLALLLFLTGLLEFSPPTSNHEVHKHVKVHFGLDDIDTIIDFEGIYEYMETFAQKNAEMQASSHEYWCEARYSKYVWNHVLSVPQWTCQSPRQYALGLSSDEQWSWSIVKGSRGLEAYPEHDGPNASVDSSSPCEDNEMALQDALGNDTVSCEGYPEACDVELGITLCPKFCGFCSPWEYRHTRLYPSPQVVMLPALVYQTRVSPAPCHGFASIFEKQGYNPLLWQSPPLDGHRHGKLLHCLDRATPLDDDFAMERDCPLRAPKSMCPPGSKFKVTKRATFAGKTVYPKLLTEPKHFVDQMRYLQWLDVQTESVTVSTMVYTEEVELFTSLSVTFRITRAGRVTPSFRIVSYRDVIGESKILFIASMLSASLIALAGLLVTFYHWCRRGIGCHWGEEMLELTSRALLGAFPIVLLVSWSQQNVMAYEYNKLLRAFLGVDGTDEELWSKLIVDFFAVKDQIYMETEWVKYQRIASYVVLYVQFVQLLMYLSAHPKMGTLTSTMVRASSHLLHFLPLFGISYVTLGFLAYWMLGEHVPAFSTFGEAMVNQVLMILGESYVTDGVEALTPGFSAMYWLYSATFMGVIFFTLTNFLLAIIVDAFCDVQDTSERDAILFDFFSDLWRTFYISARWRWKRWPSRSKLIEFLELQVVKDFQTNYWINELEREDGQHEINKSKKKVTITPEFMIASIDGLDDVMLGDMLSFYYALSAKVLVRRSQDKTSESCSPAKTTDEPKSGPRHLDFTLDQSPNTEGGSSDRAEGDMVPELVSQPLPEPANPELRRPPSSQDSTAAPSAAPNSSLKRQPTTASSMSAVEAWLADT